MPETLEITVRPAQPADLEAGARLLYEAFKSIADQRGFEPDFPSVEIASSMGKIFLNHPQISGVAAEVDGALAGLPSSANAMKYWRSAPSSWTLSCRTMASVVC